MANIFDYINAKEMAVYVQKVVDNAIPFLGRQLFPNDKQLGTDISWLKGKDGLPVALQPSNYDAKARLREHTGFESVATEMAFFREGTRIGEKDRQKLNMLMSNPNNNLALPIIKNIFDDVARLVEGVEVQAEIMRMTLLQKGVIDITSADGRARYKYDYGLSAEQKVKASVSWKTKETADPVRDIIKWCDDAELRTGVRPTKAIINRNTFLDMIQCDKLHFMINPNDASKKAFYSEEELLRAIENFTKVKFAIYSKKVGVLDHATGLPSTSQTINLVEDNFLILLPEGKVGSTVYGTTPEESDLMNGGTDAQTHLVNGAVAITTIKEPHPVNVFTIVSAVMIPSFEGIDHIVVAKTDGTNHA